MYNMIYSFYSFIQVLVTSKQIELNATGFGYLLFVEDISPLIRAGIITS